MQDGLGLRQRAFGCRERQETEEAFGWIQKAAALLPQDPVTAFGHAQLAFETGRPAAGLFEKAARLDPSNLQISHNHAAALVQEGQTDRAIGLVEENLIRHPDWLAGHALLSKIRTICGHPIGANYANACARQPTNMGLHLAWFQLMALAKNWDKAREILDLAKARMGETQGLIMSRLFLASQIELEQSKPDLSRDLFVGYDHWHDPGFDLCRVRYFLRRGEIERAAFFANRHLQSQTQSLFLPYLSLIWRLNDDPKAHWLDRGSQLIKTIEIALMPDDLANLAQVLRDLHKAKSPYLEQSVHGGTQTDGQILFHHDPAIQVIRGRITTAVKGYLDALPPQELGHPLLGCARGPIAFAGSWSVWLMSKGFHSTHTHPQGVISSAFYVDLPSTENLGSPPAGWLELGAPPPNLNLSLPAYTHIEPKPGRLVLFPSTQWHATKPFQTGERLTIAFDVTLPQIPKPDNTPI
ncbi:putative 2OG-Fe(II) oxygenase [Candidatus Phycosocius spiralis]|uniref:Tetratricopeptide repeat-containing 2OG-Fe(II) oxygenase n=1 Tax=Candidatus Phycosocius spiralis TaxID=2815099 RepID=A0ABQ4PWE8_9PROT|nr:putative 2OG-Fe(II) oxygenase [Candidatus Phycosocius spiralis]GIU67382.1 tetratricopeptide repeat-containing 2OG-Fe(II) oxygenase [Candidatus Phycosocius spiralis]